ncbi:uncharacterized protein J3R85_001750 [Psidium guajava]|nr:uncharacterized protein J3R85_001750 [Psidium guajava]
MSEPDFATTLDPIDHLPLPLLRSDVIPPALTRSPIGSTIDWIPDLAGYAWVAYGASSLLVISHLPSPLSEAEPLIAPFFRQVFDLPQPVTSVSFSSDGRVAAASGDCVFIHSLESSRLLGSFCWSQNAVLRQSSKVEAVKWTRSGDGIIAGGIEVVLWKNNSISWEIAWKFKAKQPQTLVSATWSIEGTSAAAPYLSKLHLGGSSVSEECRHVLVCQSNRKSEYVMAKLLHPEPILMIQWRPLGGRWLKRNLKVRQVLLTCCLDGAVRLWSEMDYRRARKMEKDFRDPKFMPHLFCVVAVIETNMVLGATLGENFFVNWAEEKRGLHKIGKEGSQLFPTEVSEHEKNGQCEWVVGIGPELKITFWAIHCLDEFSPLRHPRVTLWKSKELQCLDTGCLHKISNLNVRDQYPVKKAIISRNSSSGPPVLCSFIHLSPCNSMAWLLLYTQVADNVRDLSLGTSPEQKFLSGCAGGELGIDGHSGKILRVAVHPDHCVVRLAASLDSNGLLLFWSFSTITNEFPGFPTTIPSWKLSGKLVMQENGPKYTSLVWAPLAMNDDCIVLLGHHGGIDCFVVEVSEKEVQKVECHRLCTIPFCDSVPPEEGPTDIFSIPLTNKDLRFHGFMLLAAWINGFYTLSWDVSVQYRDLSGCSQECDFETKYPAWSSMSKFESSFCGKGYSIFVSPCSSQYPDSHNHDAITSFSLVCPGLSLSSVRQDWRCIDNEQCSNCPAFFMAAGCRDGSLKLWRSNGTAVSAATIRWELVGMVAAHLSSISKVCLTDCGQKIAIICGASNSDTVSTLSIWGAVNMRGAGHLLLEDTVSLDGCVIAMKWLALGNGQKILGVCMQDKLQVYAERRAGSQSLLNSGKPSHMHIWFCIAHAGLSSPAYDFIWGPQATVVVVHENHICSFSQLLFLINSGHLGNSHLACEKDIPWNSERGPNIGIFAPIFTDLDIHNFENISVESSSKLCTSRTAKILSLNCDLLASCLSVERAIPEHCFPTKLKFWSMLEILEKLGGSLPLYHPQALLFNIFSGNWRRAYLALQHLVAHSDAHGKRPKSRQIVPQMVLSSYLEGIVSESSPARQIQWSGDATSITSSFSFERGLTELSSKFDSDASINRPNSLSLKSELSNFVNTLERGHELEAMSQKEETEILAISDLLSEVNHLHSTSVYESLDEPGRRFWVSVRYKQLHFLRKCGRMASLEELVIDSASICWAFHSDCQDNLLDSFLPDASSWQEMRAVGVGLWLTDASQLRTRMEKLARSQYLKRKDPKDCALLYVSLNRLKVLAGLFKLSKDEKDKPLVGFLLRNFQEEKNKAAALKNAYVLLGRHQLELAIAFFLLGGDISSAVAVCIKNLGDDQLALVICRLVEGCGGPTEHQLITKSMLPSATEKGDYWLSSLLEWQQGNYSKSFLSMFKCQNGPIPNEYTPLSNRAAFLDPSVGLYCILLAAKNHMKKAVGEQNAAFFGRWARLITAAALERSGLPLEAMEHYSSLSFDGGCDHQGMFSNGLSEVLLGRPKESTNSSSNWLSNDVSTHLESHYKLDCALQHFSKLIKEHPSWPYSSMGSVGSSSYFEYKMHELKKLLPEFRDKLYAGLEVVQQKFSVDAASLLSKISEFAYHKGSFSIRFDLLQGYYCQQKASNVNDLLGSIEPSHLKLMLAAAAEVSALSSRFIAACSISFSLLDSHNFMTTQRDEIGPKFSVAWGILFETLILLFRKLRAVLQLSLNSNEADFIMKPFAILDLFEYLAHFAYTWFQRNLKALSLILQPLTVSPFSGHTTYNVNMEDLTKVLHQMENFLSDAVTVDTVKWDPQSTRSVKGEHGGDIVHLIPEDERWQILGCSLWEHMSRFTNHKLNFMLETVQDSHLFGASLSELQSKLCSSAYLKSDDKNMREQIELLSVFLVQSLKAISAHASSYHTKQLAALVQQKLDNGWPAMTLVWLQKSDLTEPRSLQTHLSDSNTSLDLVNSDTELSIFERLWTLWADPRIISDSFALEKINWSEYVNTKPSKRWTVVHDRMTLEENESRNNGSSCSTESTRTISGSLSKGLFSNGNSLLSSWHKEPNLMKDVTHFQNPKDILKRNGELMEALCINSINERQIAVSSNRKGIIFFNLEQELPYKEGMEHVWSEADWPKHGWADSESTLRTKTGSHMGFGAATTRMGSLAMPGRDLTGGLAFGVPGYAGIGASGLGFETRGIFEEFVEQSANLETVRTRALSSHPSMPYFLVGSSNTHIYLWKFGEEKAIATYGVLPAANSPPPYALASISALQFDPCGHRFATATLDGTICSWQLEVGGRSNICPTESSLCFNGQASDIAYVSSSGSIIAAAGCSSNNMNVVVWDTLAPPSTSRASIICHEDGARSVCVFDNDVGNSSVSPLILTGGKGGDVGLHDFRYVATGRSKRPKSSDNSRQISPATLSTDLPVGIGTKFGIENVGGMLWYIPKAHLGSVTKISPIAQTSLFLTGSKDGDVKLWDAKSAKLLHHWPKLHERHTFLQPSTRGFGGVVRAGVTDVQLVSQGFLTCGGDGSVKLVRLKDYV